jgi:hypothetical protein
MKMKKLAIASAIAMMSMSAAYAQQTPTTTTTPAETGLMTELSTSLATIFNAGQMTTINPQVDAITGVAAVYSAYTGTGSQLGYTPYVLIDGVYRVATAVEVSDFQTAAPGALAVKALTTAPVLARAAQVASTVYSAVNPVEITALAGAVNLSAINGSIDISGTNVSITGIAGKVESSAAAATTSTALAINGNNFSTTVIGAMNSSTLDIMAKTVDVSEMTKSVLNIAGLANQGLAPSITTQSFGDGTLGLATVGSTILEAAVGSTQFDMTGLVSGTDTLASNMTESLQSMNVFNMALNMAPIVAGVKIAAVVDPNAWFLNPQTGVVNLSSMQIATTAIGAMNSSITHLGKNLTTLAK